MARTILLPALCLNLLAGCAYSPVFLLEEPSLKRALPSDVAMSDYVEKDWLGNKVTVAEKLARLGAYTEGDKIRDGTGQEIRFVRQDDRSLKTTPELAKKEQDRMREWKQRYNVIEIKSDPSQVPPATLVKGNSDNTRLAPVPLPPPPQTPSPPAPLPQPAAPMQSSGWQPADPAPPSASKSATPGAKTPTGPGGS